MPSYRNKNMKHPCSKTGDDGCNNNMRTPLPTSLGLHMLLFLHAIIPCLLHGCFLVSKCLNNYSVALLSLHNYILQHFNYVTHYVWTINYERVPSRHLNHIYTECVGTLCTYCIYMTNCTYDNKLLIHNEVTN